MKAELFNYRCWVNFTDPSGLKESLEKMLRVCEFEVLGFMEHHFQPQGYTSIWLLSESHLALHTYPEEGKSYIELTSCILSKKIHFQKLVQGQFGLVEALRDAL